MVETFPIYGERVGKGVVNVYYSHW